jgi:hypothetical protein
MRYGRDDVIEGFSFWEDFDWSGDVEMMCSSKKVHLRSVMGGCRLCDDGGSREEFGR